MQRPVTSRCDNLCDNLRDNLELTPHLGDACAAKEALLEELLELGKGITQSQLANAAALEQVRQAQAAQASSTALLLPQHHAAALQAAAEGVQVEADEAFTAPHAPLHTATPPPESPPLSAQLSAPLTPAANAAADHLGASFWSAMWRPVADLTKNLFGGDRGGAVARATAATEFSWAVPQDIPAQDTSVLLPAPAIVPPPCVAAPPTPPLPERPLSASPPSQATTERQSRHAEPPAATPADENACALDVPQLPVCPHPAPKQAQLVRYGHSLLCMYMHIT